MAETHRSAPAQAGYWSVLRNNPSYRSLWLGEVVSLFGDWFNLIASAALVSHLTGSGTAVGGMFVVRMLAPFLVSPLAGVVADRFNRKWVLIFSDLSRGLVVLGFLLVRNPSQVWILYALTAVQLGISGFFFPARNAILPDIVSRRQLGAANALSAATWSVMLALGAAMGGVVAGEWGIYPAFVVDSLSFFVSAAFISRIHYRTQLFSENGKPKDETVLAAALGQYTEGLRYLRHNLDVFAIALHKGAVSLTVTGIFQVIQVILAERVFVIGEGGGTSLGLLYAVAGVGTGLGPILARRFTGDRDRPLRLTLTLSYLISVAGLLIMVPLASFPLVLFGTFLRAAGGGTNWVFSTQLLQHLVPDRVRGRVFSTEFAIFTLTNAVSVALGGWLLDNTGLGLPAMLFWMAVLSLVPAAAWTGWLLFGKRSTPPVEPQVQEQEGAEPGLVENRSDLRHS